MPRIHGRIVRITDPETVIINLGREHGIQDDSIFSVLGEQESVIDPVTGDVLGEVLMVKGKARASQVFDSFTIAKTKWTQTEYVVPSGTPDPLSGLFGHTNLFGEQKLVQKGNLQVNEAEIEPFKAQAEPTVQLGDTVQVIVADEGDTETEESEGTPIENGRESQSSGDTGDRLR